MCIDDQGSSIIWDVFCSILPVGSATLTHVLIAVGRSSGGDHYYVWEPTRTGRHEQKSGRGYYVLDKLEPRANSTYASVRNYHCNDRSCVLSKFRLLVA